MFVRLLILKLKRKLFRRSYDNIVKVFTKTSSKLQRYANEMMQESEKIRVTMDALKKRETAANKEANRSMLTLGKLNSFLS